MLNFFNRHSRFSWLGTFLTGLYYQVTLIWIQDITGKMCILFLDMLIGNSQDLNIQIQTVHFLLEINTVISGKTSKR